MNILKETRMVHLFNCLTKSVKVQCIIFREEGNNFEIVLCDSQNKIVFNGNLFTIDYGRRMAISDEGGFSKWSSEMFELMDITCKANNFLLKTNLSGKMVTEYFNQRRIPTEQYEGIAVLA